jgi:hypothetical protein
MMVTDIKTYVIIHSRIQNYFLQVFKYFNCINKQQCHLSLRLVDKGTDPTLVVAAYKKNRFYLFSCRSPRDLSSVDNDRDVFNEKPSKEDIISATEEKGAPRLYQSATIHTTVGDVHLELFPKVGLSHSAPFYWIRIY